VRVWSLATGKCEQTLKVKTSDVPAVLAISITPDGRQVLTGSDDDRVRVWTLATGQCERILNGHSGFVNAIDITPDGRLAVTGSGDKTVRVWDLATGDLIHEVPFGDSSVVGVAFVGNGRLAVTPGDGNLLIATFDPDVLVATAQSTLTRGFTLQECSRFGFGDDCPTMSDMGGPSSGAVDLLDGEYEVRWSADEVESAFKDAGAGYFDQEAELPSVVREFASGLAGVYSVSFSGGRFDITYDRMEDTWCTGSYTIRDQRVWLRSERGWCKEGQLFDAGFEIDSQDLHFEPADFHGEFHVRILFTYRPLTRTG
jgi:WD40 repeat protein